MKIGRSSWLRVAIIAGMTVVASCQPAQSTASLQTPTQRICDGISSDVGGCEARHSFTATTCAGLAEEWARELDRRLLLIIRDPNRDPAQAASVRLRQALSIVTIDMNTRLVSQNLKEGCDVPEFLAVGQQFLSPELKSGVGAAMYDNAPAVTYDEWLADVRSVLRMIDEREESPQP